jgi:hypothetical protein
VEILASKTLPSLTRKYWTRVEIFASKTLPSLTCKHQTWLEILASKKRSQASFANKWLPEINASAYVLEFQWRVPFNGQKKKKVL